MPEKLPESSEEAIELLKSFGAVEEGHFVLASGKHSSHYVNKSRVVERPAQLQELIALRLPELERLGKIDLVLSPAMGGVPVGQQVGLALECRAIYAERDAQNRMTLKRGFEIRDGENVLLVEDVITTGGTLAELKDFVLAQGGRIAAVFVIVNRSGRPDWHGIPIAACMSVDLPVWEPDDVPAWLEAIPTVRPGTKKVDK